MDKNTQQPVAWRHSHTHSLHDLKNEVELADGDEWAEPLYTAPPMPRYVLIAYGEAVRNAVYEAIRDSGLYSPASDLPGINLAAIADRYASKVQPEPANQQLLAALEAINAVTKKYFKNTDATDRQKDIMMLELESIAKSGLISAIAAAAEAAHPAKQPRCSCGDSFTSDAVCANCLAAQQPASVQPVDVPDGKQNIGTTPVKDGYFLCKCDECGWIGSSEETESGADGETYYCPSCRYESPDELISAVQTFNALLSAAPKPEGV